MKYRSVLSHPAFFAVTASANDVPSNTSSASPKTSSAAQTVYDNTATDKLPKITEAKRAALKAALDAYKTAQTEQTAAIGTASGTRIDRNALVEEATERRMWIQFAADAEWPHTDPANAPIRREFQLPATRAFIG